MLLSPQIAFEGCSLFPAVVFQVLSSSLSLRLVSPLVYDKLNLGDVLSHTEGALQGSPSVSEKKYLLYILLHSFSHP